jgi:uncharacterized protein (DUF433 family)
VKKRLTLVEFFNRKSLNYMNWTNFIASDPAILYGKPAIKGTRIGVDLILEKLAAGHTTAQLLKSYPHLKEEQIFACLAFAAEKIKNEVVHELSAAA